METLAKGSRVNIEDLEKLYPDQWVILDDCEWENKSTIKSGVLVDVCSDGDLSKKRIANRHAGKIYTYKRTSEGIIPAYIHALNFEVIGE